MKRMNVSSNLLGIVNNRKGLLILCLSLAVFGVDSAWGTKYYSKATVSASPDGGGKVYVRYNNSTKPSSPQSSAESGEDKQNSAPTHTYYFWAEVNPGYTWSSWSFSGGSPASSTEKNTSATIKANTNVNSATITATANFDVGYSNAIAKVSTGGGGQVYVTGDNVQYDNVSNWQDNQDAAKRQDVTHTYYFFAKPDKKHIFKGWSVTDGGAIIDGSKTSDKRWTKALTVTSTTSTEDSPQNFIYYAVFGDANQFYASAYAKSVPNDNTIGWCYISCNDGVPNESWWTTNKKINDNSTGSVATVDDEGQVRGNFYARACDGYMFDDWYTDATCTTKATAGTRDFSNQNHYYEDITTSATTSPGPSITRYAHFVPVMVSAATAQTVNFTAQTQTQTATLTFAVTNADAKADFNEPAVTSGDAGWTIKDWNYANNQVTVVVSFTATENTTTKGDHSATVTLTAKSGNSATGQVTAHIAMTPVYTCTIADKYLVDDNAIDLNTLWTSTSNGAKHYEITSFTPSGSNNEGATTPAISGTTLSLGQAGTLNLKMTQDAGTSSIVGSATYSLTINKRDNVISSSFAGSMYMDAKQNGIISSNNSVTPISATQTEGSTIAVLNAAQTQVTSNHNLGTATWTISQPENYKYKAANATLTVNVIQQAEATDCYVLNDESEHSFSTGITDTKGHFDTPFAVNGPAYQIEFDAKKDYLGVNKFVAQYSTDGGGNWTDVNEPDLTDSYKTFGPYNIPNNTTHIRFGAKTGGTLSKYYRNVRVTRKTYLNASDFTINTQENNTTLVYPGDEGTGSFQVDYSLANGGDLKIVCDNSKFTLDKTSQNNVDCNSGSFTVNVTYTSQTAGTDYAHVVIYNNVYRKEITITGITQKHQQTLNWKPNFDQMSLGQEVSDAASSSHGAVTYTSDNTDVIRVDNGTTLVAVAKGEAKITATAAGDDEYDEKSIEKTISVTENHVQYIVWTQSLMGLKLGGEDKTLNAYATSEEEKGAASGRSITYTSDNTSVVSVSGNQLKIVGVGTANVTARQEGGNFAGITYDAVEKVNKVVVKDPSAQCESFVYEQDGNVEEFFQMNTFEITGTEHTLTGEPAKLTFNAKRENWKIGLSNFSKGNIVVDAYTPSTDWQQVLDCGEPPIGSYQEYSVNLNREVTKIRFHRPSGGQGYHYIADAKIERARYIETSTPATFQANVGEVQQQTITLNYSNITSDLLLSMAGGANSHFSVGKTQINGDCGDAGKNIALTITYTPTANTDDKIDGKETETLFITDGTTQCEVKLYGKAAKVDRDIVWDIADENNAYTVEQIALTATAETKLHQPAGEVAYNIVGASTQGCGTIENKVLSFNKNGIVYVEASTIASDKYNQATNITKTWNVNLTPTEIVTAPEIDGDIVYGAQLSDLALKAGVGAARNTVNQQAVEGTFAITDGDISSAGEHTITVTFTPTNTAMYEGCTKEINVTILKANPSATAHASEIIYGATVESSLLTNGGTTDGTWTWTDEKKDQVLAVGTYEGLQVHFTPSDAANYNEIDGVVSLKVIAATPVLTWTAEHATANTVDALTFAASSTNTDTDAKIIYSIIAGDDCASIDASTGVLTITKAGTITVQASQVATTNYSAVNIETTCTISVAPTTITTAPTATPIVSGTNFSDVVLTGGEAQNTINNQAVEGTFTVTDGDLVNIGQQTLTITFTPNNTDMYAGCTTTITATIVSRTPTVEEVGTPSAANIDYGAPVCSSELTGNGTLAGTWSWTDTRKNDVLNAGTYDNLQVHFVPENKNYNEADATVSLTVNKATPTLSWETAPSTADVNDEVTYIATSNHNESEITYSITDGADCATIDANTGVLTITKAGTITVQASQAASTNYEEATLTQTTTLTGVKANEFTGNGDWNNPQNWTNGVPTDEGGHPNVVISGNMTISQPVSVGNLTIENSGQVTITGSGDLTVYGSSATTQQYGNLIVNNGGNVTIQTTGSLTVGDFVIESSIGTQSGTSISGQVTNGDKVIYTNGAYIDINMDPKGTMDDTQWYGFTVPFPVDVESGVYRKEGNTYRKCTYGSDYMIAEYDATQRLNTGKGWKYIKTGQLQPGHFYYFTVNGSYNTYRFKAAENTLTPNNSMSIAINGDGPNANWNAVGNSTLTYVNVTGTGLPQYVQTYINGQSTYQVVKTSDAQFVVGCPFFIQASENTTMVLQQANQTIEILHYAPRAETAKPMCVRIAAEGQRFSDQMYLTASEDALDEYELSLDLAKAGVGTKSAQLWVNAYGQQLCVNNAVLTGNQAYYGMGIYAPKAGNYELSLPYVPTNGTLYLLQNGYPIWNLNESPYTLECVKGTTNEYGLLFVAQGPQAPTGSQTISGNQSAQKILKDQQIYIQKNGTIFTISGQKVK